MTDPEGWGAGGDRPELDGELRRALQQMGAAWSPGQPAEVTRRTLVDQVRRRRRAEAVLLTGAAAVVALAVTLGHAGAANDTSAVGLPSLPRPTVVHTGPTPTAQPSPPPAGATAPTPTTSRPAGVHGLPARGTEAGNRHRATAPGTTPSAQLGGPPTSALPPGPPSTTGTAPATTSPTTTSQTTATTQPSPPTTTTQASVPSTTTLPSPTTTLPQTYTFTNADNGRTVTVSLGAVIQLDVTGCPGSSWRPVRSSDPGVVAPESTSTAVPGGDGVIATLRAVGSGRAVLRLVVTSTCVAPGSSLRLTVNVG